MSYDLVIKAALLGLIEGATEFLPVSSTGHLIVAGEFLNFTGEKAKTFEIFIQLGAILAVVWLYRKKLFVWNAATPKIGLNVLIAFIPAAIVGFLFHDFIKLFLFRVEVVAAALIIGGILIFIIESLDMKRNLVCDFCVCYTSFFQEFFLSNCVYIGVAIAMTTGKCPSFYFCMPETEHFFIARGK